MEENRRRADPDDPVRAALHDAALRHGGGRHRRQRRRRPRPGSPATSGRSRPRARCDYLERYEAYIRDVVEPRMKAIAPETGVAVELVAEVPGLRPETDGAAERLMRRITGDNGTHVVVLRHGGRPVPAGRLVDRGLRPGRHRPGAPAGRISSRSANSRPASASCAG